MTAVPPASALFLAGTPAPRGPARNHAGFNLSARHRDVDAAYVGRELEWPEGRKIPVEVRIQAHVNGPLTRIAADAMLHAKGSMSVVG
jgi:hypothetical protein